MNWLKSKKSDSYINKMSYITGTKSGRKNDNKSPHSDTKKV